MKNLFFLFFSICAFTTNAQDAKLTYFLSGEVSLTNILISEHPLFNSENLGSAAKLSGVLRTGVRYQCSENLGLNSGLEFGVTRYGEDHTRRLVGGPGNQTLSTEQSSSIRAYNLGLPLFLDFRLGAKMALLTGAKYQYNFSGKRTTDISVSSVSSEPSQDFSITKNNFSGMIGFRYYPKGTDEIRKKMFLGLSAEYFFIADKIFFALNDVNRFSANFNVGYHF